MAGEHVSGSHLGDDDGASTDFLCTCCGNIPCLPFRFICRNGTKGGGHPQDTSALILTVFQNGRTNLYFHQQHKSMG